MVPSSLSATSCGSQIFRSRLPAVKDPRVAEHATAAHVDLAAGRSADDVYAEQNAFLARRTRGGLVRSLPDGSTVLISHVPRETGGWLATDEDITDRPLAAEELWAAKNKAEMADRAKTQFPATTSHAIRAPFDVMLRAVNPLLDELNFVKKPRRHLQHIQTAGSTLPAVVNDVLDFPKIEDDPIEREPQSFSPVALIDSAVSMVQNSADRKGLAFHCGTAGYLPASVLGARDGLRSVLLHLLSHAITFTACGCVTPALEGGAVTGGLWSARCAVTDTGIGLSPECMDRLLAPIGPVNGSIRREFGGTGPRLTISKELIDAMVGGSASAAISAAGPGSGSTCSFRRSRACR